MSYDIIRRMADPTLAPRRPRSLTADVVQSLGDRIHEGRLPAGENLPRGADLMMAPVLRRLEGSGMLAEYPNVDAYVARGVARPAYQRAFAAQLAVFTDRAKNG